MNSTDIYELIFLAKLIIIILNHFKDEATRSDVLHSKPKMVLLTIVCLYVNFHIVGSFYQHINQFVDFIFV